MIPHSQRLAQSRVLRMQSLAAVMPTELCANSFGPFLHSRLVTTDQFFWAFLPTCWLAAWTNQSSTLVRSFYGLWRTLCRNCLWIVLVYVSETTLNLPKSCHALCACFWSVTCRLNHLNQLTLMQEISKNKLMNSSFGTCSSTVFQKKLLFNETSLPSVLICKGVEKLAMSEL